MPRKSQVQDSSLSRQAQLNGKKIIPVNYIKLQISRNILSILQWNALMLLYLNFMVSAFWKFATFSFTHFGLLAYQRAINADIPQVVMLLPVYKLYKYALLVSGAITTVSDYCEYFTGFYFHEFNKDWHLLRMFVKN